MWDVQGGGRGEIDVIAEIGKPEPLKTDTKEDREQRTHPVV